MIASKRIALSFTRPFKKLQENMGALLRSKTLLAKPRFFHLSEFNFIQDFIYQRFQERERHLHKINLLGKKAMQAVHDIKSPASAILMYAKDGVGLPESERVALRHAAERVYDIANSLVSDQVNASCLF